MYIIGNEWNKSKKDSSLVASFFGKFAIMEACDQVTYEKGKRKYITQKLQGYGCGIVSKKEDNLLNYECLHKPGDLNFEIVPSELILSPSCSIGCLSVYRSPSMNEDSEIELFYDQVERYIKHMKSNSKISGIIYIGDPNTEASSLANSLESSLMQKHSLSNLIGNFATRVGSETQPDSCFAYFDCKKVTVSAQ